MDKIILIGLAIIEVCEHEAREEEGSISRY